VSHSKTERAVWSLQGNLAELNCGALSGRIDVTRPQSGLHRATLNSLPADISLMGVRHSDALDDSSWPAPLAEAYVRANDLVAAYQQTPDWPFAPQLYWRANLLRGIEGVIASASLLVSVQTSLLDTCPKIGVTSTVPHSELLLVSNNGSEQTRVEPLKKDTRISPSDENCCVLARSDDEAFSYVEFMPASDFHEAFFRVSTQASTIEWRLFADFLEKGVIRRARIYAALLPRENDVEYALACCEASERLQLPLTT
jgi:hypothetical protein